MTISHGFHLSKTARTSAIYAKLIKIREIHLRLMPSINASCNPYECQQRITYRDNLFRRSNLIRRSEFHDSTLYILMSLQLSKIRRKLRIAHLHTP